MARSRRGSTPTERLVPTNPRGSQSVRVLKAFDPFTFKTLQSGNRKRVTTAGGATMSAIAVPKSQVVKQGMTRSRSGNPRRLHVRDPYNKNSVSGPMATGATVATFSPVADQFTNNPNPKFDPSRGPGSVTVIRVPRPVQKVSKGDQAAVERTHGTVFKPNRFTLFGGKTLRRL